MYCTLFCTVGHCFSLFINLSFCVYCFANSVSCIRSKSQDDAVQTAVYKMRRTMLEETSEATFNDLLTKLLAQLQSDDKTTAFQRYFSSVWVPKAQEWAFCYRCGLGFNTNMYVEAFHRTFKHNYLKGKFNKRDVTCLMK